jgi:polar amino acid transport system substrate-binding protein
VGIKKVQSFDNIKLAFEALEIGRIDAIINDFPVNAYMSAQTQNTEVASLIKTNESYGIGVALRNAQMLAGVDKALAAIKADGTYKSIYDKWFAPVTN